ncbi:hypothetical protein BKP45_14345 [Anaerobacillus alkalidiazotrophicus]|uniref:Uncharacterized protein n=1 Tax=Anaerobacillus alkalidiazotrophicus TaxID=472963 RepID=A0A1S2M675_9BACI|nr:hypothetical protein [Anaerobacillus alkalidiazotrophicus]OIJ19145.1 hypothetical protein BKP45_14345 [Anaerobacillus alkalidiazotrophicus]
MALQKGIQPRSTHPDGKKESIINDSGGKAMGISADANPQNVDQKFNNIENRVHNTSEEQMEELIEEVNIEKDSLR